VWVVRKMPAGPARSGRTVASEAAQGPGYTAIAAAHSQAIARLSEDLAAAVRSLQRRG
jgi:hypothetical protein